MQKCCGAWNDMTSHSIEQFWYGHHSNFIWLHTRWRYFYVVFSYIKKDIETVHIKERLLQILIRRFYVKTELKWAHVWDHADYFIQQTNCNLILNNDPSRYQYVETCIFVDQVNSSVLPYRAIWDCLTFIRRHITSDSQNSLFLWRFYFF